MLDPPGSEHSFTDELISPKRHRKRLIAIIAIVRDSDCFGVRDKKLQASSPVVAPLDRGHSATQGVVGEWELQTQTHLCSTAHFGWCQCVLFSSQSTSQTTTRSSRNVQKEARFCHLRAAPRLVE